MRILFLLYSLGAGGAERVTATLANYWADQGHQVTLLTFAPVEDDFYSLRPSISRISLNQVGISAHPVAAAAANIHRIRALRQALIQHRPQVAIAMMASANVLLAIAGFGLQGLVTVGSERIHPPQLPLGRFWEVLRWGAYGLLDAVVAQTERSADWIRSHTLAGRVVVIENPLTPDPSAKPPLIPPSALVASGDRIVLAVGRLVHQKGFDLLLRACARLSWLHQEWRLVILGEGPDRPVLERFCLAHGLEERVLMPGRLGNVSEWYARADLFVLSSRYEGFPNVLAEAMAAGLPVVSSNCPTGPSDLVHNGVDGILVPVGDTDALAEALDLLMRNALLRQSLGATGRQIGSRLDLGRIAACWESLFRQFGVEL